MKTFEQSLTEATKKLTIFYKIDFTKSGKNHINLYDDFISGIDVNVSDDYEEEVSKSEIDLLFKKYKDFKVEVGDKVTFADVQVDYDLTLISKGVVENYDSYYNHRTKQTLLVTADKKVGVVV